MAGGTDPIDSDNDNIDDFLDTDSDSDGISDLLESTADTDLDGTLDFRDALEVVGLPDLDTDGDGVADVDDIDDDNDGILDVDESASFDTGEILVLGAADGGTETIAIDLSGSGFSIGDTLSLIHI